jgi:hypothetical protein
MFGSSEVRATPSASTDTPNVRRRLVLAWGAPALLGAGVLLGLALWAEWGFAIAFEAIRAYCF